MYLSFYKNCAKFTFFFQSGQSGLELSYTCKLDHLSFILQLRFSK